MGEEYICKIPDCKCGGRKGRSELEDENAELHKLLAKHEKSWRAVADAIGTDGGYGGVDGKKGEYWGTAECVIRRVSELKSKLVALNGAATAVFLSDRSLENPYSAVIGRAELNNLRDILAESK